MDFAPISMAYCGPPPLPETLWGRWNFDPILLGIMALAVIAYALTQRSATRRQHLAFAAAITTLLVSFVSPLCALTVALFSARVTHHVLLITIAAPLLAWTLLQSAKNHRLLPSLPLEGRAGVGVPQPTHLTQLPALITPLMLLHAVTFWLWHAPDAYNLALTNTAIYWLMQLTLLGTATLLWAAILTAAPGRAIVALLFTTLQMGLLGALLVFAGQPLYAPHLATTLAFGLDPRSDQQLAGLIMWVPASLPYLGVALYQLTRWLQPTPVRQP